MHNKTLIYIGLLAVVGWFASSACFPIYRTPMPAQVSPTPCPSSGQGQPACLSPAPPSPAP